MKNTLKTIALLTLTVTSFTSYAYGCNNITKLSKWNDGLISKVNLTGACGTLTLPNGIISKVKLSQSTALSHTNVSGATILDSDLSYSKITESNLSHVTFKRTNLDYVTFYWSDLSKVDIIGSTLRGVKWQAVPGVDKYHPNFVIWGVALNKQPRSITGTKVHWNNDDYWVAKTNNKLGWTFTKV